MKTLKNMTNDERSLLLYLETRAVGYGGLVAPRHMNAEDFCIAKKWDKEGFIGFGRLVSESCNYTTCSHWVTLSEEAWELAHKERRARQKRLYDIRTWTTTKEKREAIVV